MGKYSEIVKSKNQNDKPENQKTVKVENNETIEQESLQTSEPDNQIAREAALPVLRGNSEGESVGVEKMVNLSIKVPKRLRQKWVAESRLRGTTLTAIITDYLKSELGD